jgi:hypothetical protein
VSTNKSNKPNKGSNIIYATIKTQVDIFMGKLSLVLADPAVNGLYLYIEFSLGVPPYSPNVIGYPDPINKAENSKKLLYSIKQFTLD